MSQKKVPVYGQKGEVEQHTKANARDLVANTNGYWSWNPKKKSTPMDAPPFVTLTPASNKPQSHEILERMGTGAVRDVQEVQPEPEADSDGDDAGESGIVTVDDPNPDVDEPIVDAVPEPVEEVAPEASVSDESKPRHRRKRFEG